MKNKMINTKKVEQATTDLLLALGVDINDANFKGTPERMGRAYNEIFHGLNDIKEEEEKLFSKSFPSDNDEMVIIKDIHVFSMCPHHLLPVEMIVHIAYIPNGKVIGLSKLPRLIELYAKRPVLQEQLCVDIVDSLMKHLSPLGAAIVIKGRHYCMIMRGIQKREAWTITSCVRGVFRDNKEKAREEFLKLINHD
ncbi:MAG: GTP cyclohydrolase I FolE [Candidatus Paceibacterota bacterium]|jgi:GTP cyclohydrolase I